jgi:hypothetical protein
MSMLREELVLGQGITTRLYQATFVYFFLKWHVLPGIMILEMILGYYCNYHYSMIASRTVPVNICKYGIVLMSVPSPHTQKRPRESAIFRGLSSNPDFWHGLCFFFGTLPSVTRLQSHTSILVNWTFLNLFGGCRKVVPPRKQVGQQNAIYMAA